MGLGCVSRIVVSRGATRGRVTRRLRGLCRRRRSRRVGLKAALCKPRHSSVHFLIGRRSIRHFNSRNRRQAATLTIGLTRVSLVGRRANRCPLLLLSSILSRLSSSHRARLLATVRSGIRAFLAAADLDNMTQRLVGHPAVFRVTRKAVSGRSGG